MNSVHVFVLVNIFSLAISTGETCDLVKTIIDFQILGHGFHRTIKVVSNFSSTLRFTNCRVSYLFQIPDGAYVDVDELNHKMPLVGAGGESRFGMASVQHCFAGGPFDVEQPAGSPNLPQLQPIFFHSARIQRKVFIFDDTLEYPIHLRYHHAIGSKDEPSNVVEFNSPRVFLRCEANETFMTDHTCKRHVEKIPCECNLQSSKCGAISLNAANTKRIRLSVPVGNKDHKHIVSFITLCFIFLSVLYLLYSLTPKVFKDSK